MPKGTPIDEKARALMRDRIYRQACSLFERQGIAAATMRQIAAECGVGASTLYDYFPGKEAILDEFFKREGDAVVAIAESVSAHADPGEGIIRLLSAIGRFWLDNLALSRAVSRELYTLQKETIETALKVRGLVLEALRSLFEKQQSGPAAVPLRIGSGVGAGVLLELYRNLFSADGGEPEELAHLAWSLFLDGARRRE